MGGYYFGSGSSRGLMRHPPPLMDIPAPPFPPFGYPEAFPGPFGFPGPQFRPGFRRHDALAEKKALKLLTSKYGNTNY